MFYAHQAKGAQRPQNAFIAVHMMNFAISEVEAAVS